LKIAVIGAGNVGGGLATAFAAAGHEVVFGVRDPGSEKCRTSVAAAAGSTATSPAKAVAGADVVVFALRWPAVPGIVATLPRLDGRVVIDAMNRFDGDPVRSTTEDLAELLPGARVVKAFNTIGFENLTTAHSRSLPAVMFVAGDDVEAKQVALDLATEIGFLAEDAGPLANAKTLEGMVRVWLAIAQRHGRTVGYALSLG
jgi:8-hydroxy-5-deazaflavin:NADPH oxidoreductase